MVFVGVCPALTRKPPALKGDCVKTSFAPKHGMPEDRTSKRDRGRCGEADGPLPTPTFIVKSLLLDLGLQLLERFRNSLFEFSLYRILVESTNFVFGIWDSS